MYVITLQRPSFHSTEPLSLCYSASFGLSKCGGKMGMTDSH